MEKIQEAPDTYEVKTDPHGGHIDHYGITEASSGEKSEPEVAAEVTATEVDWEQDEDRIEKLHKAIDGKPHKLHHSKPLEALQNAI